MDAQKPSAAGCGRVPRELAERFAGYIRCGRWLPGRKIPPIRKLAADCRVSPASVGAALRILRDRELVTSRRGSGVYVNTFERIVGAGGPEERSGVPFPKEPARESVLHFLFHIDSQLSCHSSPLYTEVLCLMQEEVERVGWRLRIGDAAKLGEILSGREPLNTVGVIYMPDIRHPYDLDWPDLPVPRVLFCIGEKSFDTSFVTPDNYCGGYIAARHLLETREELLIFSRAYPPSLHLGYKPYRDRICGATDFRIEAGLTPPETAEISCDGDAAAVFEKLMALPRSKRPGIMLCGTIEFEYLTEVFRQSFPGADLDTEFRLVEFADFAIPEKPRHALVTFSRRVMCREVVELIRRLGVHPDDRPIVVKIPMNLVLPEEK